jgi:DNA-binding IscR family transcriptional regulator
VTERDCAVRQVFQQVRDETARILDGTTLAAAASAGPGDRTPGPSDVSQPGGSR